MFASKKSINFSGASDARASNGFLKRIRRTIGRTRNDKPIYYSKTMLSSFDDDQRVIIKTLAPCRKDLDTDTTVANNLALMNGESSSKINGEYMNVNEMTCDSSEIYATANDDEDALEKRHMVISHYGAINTPGEKDANENEADYEKQGARPKGKSPVQIHANSATENLYTSTLDTSQQQELNPSKAWVQGLSKVTENEPQQLCPATSITNYTQSAISCQRSTAILCHDKVDNDPNDLPQVTKETCDKLSTECITPEMECETSTKEITNELICKHKEVNYKNTGDVSPILIKRSSRGDVDEKNTNTPFIAEILTEEDVRLEKELQSKFEVIDCLEKGNMVCGDIENCLGAASYKNMDNAAANANGLSFDDRKKSDQMKTEHMHLDVPPKVDRRTKPPLTRVQSCQGAVGCPILVVPPSPPPPLPPRSFLDDFDMLQDIDDLDSDDETHVTMEHFLGGSDKSSTRKTRSLPRPPGLTSDSKDSIKSSTMPFKTRFSQIFKFKRPSVIRDGKRLSSQVYPARPLPDIPSAKILEISEQTNRPNCYLPVQPQDLSSLPENQDNDVPPAIPERDVIVNEEAEKTRGEFTSSLRKISDCGWYWGPMSWDDAESRLENTPDGSFLVRDSSDDRHILSLSFRAQGTTHHTRIEHHNGKFSFWSQPTSHGSASIVEFIEEAMQHSRNGRYLYFLRPRLPGFPPAPVQLLYQISRFQKARSLQHMCRFVIRKHARLDHIDLLPLPKRLKEYLKEGQYYTPDDILKDI
ncbi:uncharacterized protein LOC117104972 [Anneissia japonica]|uniref:uncharacterized protein LOC117104972 n=1 Tax=Anneissia japonica TaxID=1529436 RepID=UPI0014257046|nr:uncharacterized protein LOC117104972 [Anneissia japonica]